MDRQGDRTETQLVDSLKANHKNSFAVAVLEFERIMSIGCSVIPEPVPGNPYHCNLCNEDGFSVINHSKGRKLAEACKVV